MTCKNGGCTIKLLGNQYAGNLVRPCQFPESQNQIGAATQCRIMSVRSANGDDQLTLAFIAQMTDMARKSFRSERLAAILQQDQGSTMIHSFMKTLGFLGFAQICRLAPAFGNFANSRKFQSQWWPSLGKTVKITLDQLPFGAGFHPAHGKNAHTHVVLNADGLF